MKLFCLINCSNSKIVLSAGLFAAMFWLLILFSGSSPESSCMANKYSQIRTLKCVTELSSYKHQVHHIQCQVFLLVSFQIHAWRLGKNTTMWRTRFQITETIWLGEIKHHRPTPIVLPWHLVGLKEHMRLQFGMSIKLFTNSSNILLIGQFLTMHCASRHDNIPHVNH